MKPSLAATAAAIALAVLTSTGFAQAQPQTIDLHVNADKVIKKLDDGLYGHFLEHIYHSVNGGLWGEVVWNRSFEEGPPAPAGARGRGRGPAAASGPASAPAAPPPAPVATAPAAFPIRHWMPVGGATITVDGPNGPVPAFNSQRSALISTETSGGGLAQANFCLRKGDTLRGSLFVRGTAADGILVRLVEGEKVIAEQTLPKPIDTQWTEVPLALTPNADVPAATLQIVSKGNASFHLDQVSLMPDSYKANGGFRTDLLQAVEGLKPASLRWPGGSFVGNNGGYRWKGGIGPQSKRVGKVGWDELEPFAFGTDEFISLCKKIHSEPIVVVYLGSRTAGADHSEFVKEAAEWVEYCNGPATSPMGKLRAANGHPEPYNVKYWEIDNEVWSMQPDDYVRVVKEFVGAMKKVDPTIKTIACGSGGFSTGRFTDGDVAVINQAADVVDYLSLHHYENATRFDTGPATATAYFDKMADLIAKSKNPNLKIYMSEWNLSNPIDWRSGLYAGGILNDLERHPAVGMACPALFLRHASAPAWDNSFINFDNKTWFAAPNYVIMKLFRDHFQPNLLEVTVADKKLNITATKSDDGKKLVLKLVNPSDQPLGVSASVIGRFGPAQNTFQFVAPDNLMLKNSFENPKAVHVEDGKVARLRNDTGANNVVYVTLPRWSVGVVELTIP